VEETLSTPAERPPSRLGRMRDSVQFRLFPPDWDALISDELSFGDAANEVFLDRLRVSSRYLEFGSGSSTLAAVQLCCDVTSVDSDLRFLEAVARRARPSSPRMLYADIGPTGPWGVPRRKRLSEGRLRKWGSYPFIPWQERGPSYRADVVLIDGRFRVACALAVALHQADSMWTLLVDDYAGRREYWQVESFAELIGLHGRMAEFVPKPAEDPETLKKALSVALRDWR
jgi:hypothetical protein